MQYPSHQAKVDTNADTAFSPMKENRFRDIPK
jgi:hypothetical protein